MAKAKCIKHNCSEIGKLVEVEPLTLESTPRCKKCGEDLIVEREKDIKKYLVSGVVALLLLGVGYRIYNGGGNDEVKVEPITPAPPPIILVPKTIMNICGSNLINHDIMPKLAIEFLEERGYRDVHKELTDNEHKVLVIGTRGTKKEAIEILSDGSWKGYADLLAETCDLATSYGEMNHTIASKFDFEIKTEAYEDPFLLDAIAIVVHKNNPIKWLEPHQLRKVFSGEITDWSELTNGQKQGKIVLYSMAESSGVYHEFVKDLKPDSKRFSIASHKSFVKHEDLESQVALTPNAIGFVSNQHTTSNVTVIKIKEGDSFVAPKPATILSEEYDFFDELYLYTQQRTRPLAKTFQAYLNRADVQKRIAKRTKFVAMNIVTKKEMDYMSQEVKKKRMQNKLVPDEYKWYMKELIQTPINFHFDTGKSHLDHEAYKHIVQLKDLLSKEGYENITISLIGFSDGGRYRNMTNEEDRRAKISLSKRRAETVKFVLQDIFPNIKINITGFGGNEHLLYAPHADSKHERKLDRRVEVWLKVNS